MYRVFIKYCVFSKDIVIFLTSASSSAALVFYLPLCTHRGKTERGQSQEFTLKIFEKTHYLKNTL